MLRVKYLLNLAFIDPALCLLIDSCRFLDFRVHMAFDGSRLINHTIRTIEFVQEDFCGALCFMELSCVSYNMEITSGSSIATKCELNNSTHIEHPNDLVQQSNYIYRGIKVTGASNCNFCLPCISYNVNASSSGQLFYMDIFFHSDQFRCITLS